MNSNINQQFKSDNKQSVFSDWLVKLKQEGKTDEEIGQLLAGVAKLSALDIYAALMTSLTEEDMKEVEAISGDEAAKKRMEELFTKRAGMSIDQLVQQSQDAFATGYLKAG
ncbi:MAG: hypothetical protein UX17_C0036G0007 [Parcubacteria group bacterium GW2011_GWC2_45_7]|nr:MAG: hypothetical protein UX17_C0036G0007 [Parcubacteria group bacterium GW2011_GWC2_45_7]